MSVTQLHPTASQQIQGKNVVAIASGKGGVGKTWFSITLAHTFHTLKKNTLLFDGDLGLANVDIQIGLMAKHDISEVINGQISITAAIQKCESGFDVLAGKSGSGDLATLPNSKLLELRQNLFNVAGSYDVMLIDLGAGVDRTVRQLAGSAAVTLVVTTDEPTALTDAYAFLKLSHLTNPNQRLEIVVNRSATVQEGERTYQTLSKACQNFLKFTPELAGIVRNDRHVSDAIRHQTPLLTRSPHCEAALDVKKIAEKVYTQLHV